PWLRERWCIPEVSPAFVAAMEDVLDLYAEPFDPDRPVVGFDERPLQLTAARRARRPAAAWSSTFAPRADSSRPAPARSPDPSGPGPAQRPAAAARSGRLPGPPRQSAAASAPPSSGWCTAAPRWSRPPGPRRRATGCALASPAARPLGPCAATPATPHALVRSGRQPTSCPTSPTPSRSAGVPVCRPAARLATLQWL